MPRMIDLTGRRFGRLLVIEPTEHRDGSAVMWRCQCDCGKVVEVSARSMLHSGVVSCGCLRREKARVNLGGDITRKLGRIEGTNVSRISSAKPQRNNRAGFRGVSWHKYPHGGGAWIAVIYFKRKRYRLGFFDTPEEASKAYLQAKEHIHGDFVAWYNEHVRDFDGDR